MTDMPNIATPRHSLLKPDARTVKRNRAEARFKSYGIAAIAVGLLMLAILLTTIIGRGVGAFQQTFLTLNVQLLEEKLDKVTLQLNILFKHIFKPKHCCLTSFQVF